MSSLAKTDYDSMFGIPTFIKDCVDKDIKPIVGVEFKVDNKYPVVFIALNRIGYKNLVKMTTTAWCERKKKAKNPFILVDDIQGEGLVALVPFTMEINNIANLGIFNKEEYIEISDPEHTENVKA
ncbi:hypothetical protein LCGC14_3085210, partial [marine sediment metagenome]